jgi:hemerythrin
MGVTWRDSLAINVPKIDEQHKELLSRFDQLLKACEAGRGIDELRGLLSFLDEYVITHFTDEEAIQRSHNYPGYAAHRQEHAWFISKLHALKEEIASEGVAVHHVMDTNNMLLKWLINHISKVDTELGRFLNTPQRS